jgi:hypothetical protein
MTPNKYEVMHEQMIDFPADTVIRRVMRSYLWLNFHNVYENYAANAQLWLDVSRTVISISVKGCLSSDPEFIWEKEGKWWESKKIAWFIYAYHVAEIRVKSIADDRCKAALFAKSDPTRWRHYKYIGVTFPQKAAAEKKTTWLEKLVRPTTMSIPDLPRYIPDDLPAKEAVMANPDLPMIVGRQHLDNLWSWFVVTANELPEKEPLTWGEVLQEIRASLTKAASAAGGEGPDGDEAASYVFRRKGEYWEVAYGDNVSRLINHTNGMEYIARLLRAPNQEIDAVELVSGGNGNGDESRLDWDDTENMSDGDGYQEVLDSAARKHYKKRLTELNIERADAERRHDSVELTRIDADYKRISEEIDKNTGLGGRPRAFSSQSERARTSVKNSIVRAIGKIKAVNQSLATHLEDCIETGTKCEYKPKQVVSWLLD